MKTLSPKIKMVTQPPLFIKACALAEIPPTRRQLSKFNMGRGLAHDHKSEAKKAFASGEKKEE